MTPWDEYRVKAAELHARAACEGDPALKAELENLARSYLRLAEVSALRYCKPRHAIGGAVVGSLLLLS
jgi:hypothetical protein